MYNLLTDPIISVCLTEGTVATVHLPKLYELLLADRVESFPALRPHQRHAWHALICQLGALACIRSGFKTLPNEHNGWETALKSLTPDFPDGEAWSLVAPLNKPAFMQPVIGVLEGLKSIDTPDMLDILVTSKNHDIKRARITKANPEEWLFALVSLQTMEGFLGSGNYGASRMNGGFSNRPGFSLSPPGGIGAHVRRDVGRLISLRDQVLDDQPIYDEEGLALVWLVPWDGTMSLTPKELDPYYIEICRRVRFVFYGEQISVRGGTSKAPRISFGPGTNGITGDPWTPIEIKDGGAKALTVDGRGFFYKRMSEILFQNGFSPAPLQTPGPGDNLNGFLTLIARALARGQGKTEGLHERRVLIPRRVVRLLTDGQVEELVTPSKERIQQVGSIAKALRYGLMMLFQNGPDDFKVRDPNSSNRAEGFLGRFDQAVDGDFFEQLFVEIQADNDTEKRKIRAKWLDKLRERALVVLREAETGSPVSSVRRYRAFVRAENAFNASFYKSFRDPYFPKAAKNEAA